MAWITTVSPEEATGPLRERYEEAVRRAGRVWNIVRLMSLRPQQIKDAIEGMYVTCMYRPTPGLPRALREMIAVVVSQANRCHY